MQEPLVSICCITYNHAKFLEKCLDGILMQKVNFPLEIIIHDDASTDGTDRIILRYKKKYPELFKVIIQKENQVSRGISGIYSRFVYPKARGRFIALCEGDDYWTDRYKLQRQVDFLKNNPDYTLCVGGYIRENNGIRKKFKFSGIIPKDEISKDGFTFHLEDTVKGWFTKTLTAVFVNRPEILSQLEMYKYGRDVHLIYHLLRVGKGYYMNKVFGIYNVHDSGIHSSLDTRKQLERAYNLYEELYLVNNEPTARKLFMHHCFKSFRFGFRLTQERFNTWKYFRKGLLLVRSFQEVKYVILAFYKEEEIDRIKHYLGLFKSSIR